MVRNVQAPQPNTKRISEPQFGIYPISSSSLCLSPASAFVAWSQICDVLCCIWLMILYWRFKHEIVDFEEKADKENVTPADYAVEVRGVPVDAKDEVRTA